MKRIFSLIVAVIFSVSVVVSIPAFAEEKSKLKDFESEAGKPSKSSKSSTSSTPSTSSTSSTTSSYGATDVVVQGLMELLMNFFLMGLSQTGVAGYKELKESWSPALPNIRAEAAYQYVAGNLTGLTGRLEAGYMVFGVDGEFTRYFEKAPNNSLNMWQAHALLRTMFAEFFATNLALGVRQVRGEQSRTGFDVGMPLYIFINKHFIVDVQPFLALVKGKRNIYDISGGFSYKYKYVGAHVGYRGIFVGDAKLHGPRIGVFFQW